MILLDSAILPTGAAILLPEQFQNAPLNWTLQCGRQKARGWHYAVDSINTKAIDTPCKMFYETLNCGSNGSFFTTNYARTNLYFLTYGLCTFELSDKCVMNQPIGPAEGLKSKQLPPIQIIGTKKQYIVHSIFVNGQYIWTKICPWALTKCYSHWSMGPSTSNAWNQIKLLLSPAVMYKYFTSATTNYKTNR